MEVVDTFLLTVGAAHKLFGYDLDAIRHYDPRWNGDRTHILESYGCAAHGVLLLSVFGFCTSALNAACTCRTPPAKAG
jgi:hypothetical protein